MDATVVEAAEEVGVGEPDAEDEAVTAQSSHARLLVAPNLADILRIRHNYTLAVPGKI